MIDLEKSYDASQVEDKIYQKWLDSGYFNPDKLPERHQQGEPFSMVLPPPNVTGTLHMGHAFEDTLQDIVIRYQRMQGKKTLWLPGTDHAAIATQAKFEKKLYKKEKKSRHDFSREEFLQLVDEFALSNQQNILDQLKKMGLSLDWSRLSFTLDEQKELAVRTAFKKMYDAGIIYRGYRVVNWDPKGQTTVSDDEVMHEPTQATLYTFKYSKDFPISIATTRPETKVGDTGVAVHPDDKRYKEYVGQTFAVNFAGVGLSIKVVADESVDPEFGTGALGVTPAHSLVDWEMAQRHDLPLQPVINEFAKMTVEEPSLQGKKVTEAREIIVQWLKDNDLLEQEELIEQNISKAERTGGTIEPLPKLQWFINVNKEFAAGEQSITLKQLMKQVVESGQIKILPERFEKIYYHWIANLRDWCISRQIIYGHRVPVWYKGEEVYVGIEPPSGDDWQQDTDTLDTWFSSGLWSFSTMGWSAGKTWDLKIYDSAKNFEALANGTKRFETRAGTSPDSQRDWSQFKAGDVINFSLVKEGTEKVLSDRVITKQVASIHHFNSIDALLEKFDLNQIHPDKPEEYRDWWDSRPPFKERIEKYGVWAFELKNYDLPVYHPTSIIMPGYEILFFWVARMILMTGFLLGDVPFRQVYLHGIVRDSKGRKFSKSLDLGSDPLDVAREYGTDALRMSLIAGVAPGNDTIFDLQKVKGYKHFGNKLWNIARFILSSVESSDWKFEAQTEADKNILDKLDATIKNATTHLDALRLHEAAEEIYQFTWHELADIYLEASKAQLQDEKLAENTKKILLHNLITVLKLLHPFMPFITEHIWQILTENKLLKKGDLLLVAQWPK